MTFQIIMLSSCLQTHISHDKFGGPGKVMSDDSIGHDVSSWSAFAVPSPNSTSRRMASGRVGLGS
jgi:hypothetical protein